MDIEDFSVTLGRWSKILSILVQTIDCPVLKMIGDAVSTSVSENCVLMHVYWRDE